MGKQNEYLKILQKASSVSDVKWWPKYVYHFTDISNAVQIINDGMLYARGNSLNQMQNDNASSEIINITNFDIKKYVRFYFRPKTPTQFHNEGYKPKECRHENYKDADIPVPIFFLFESCEMLNLPSALFSEKSLASPQSHLINDIEEFRKFDFKKIYSNGPYHQKEIKLYRHAELVIPNQCNLRNLKHILCRSQAEYQTLCFQLKKLNKFNTYKNIIGVKSTNEIFNKRSLFISRVSFDKFGFTIFIENTQLLKVQEVIIKIIININNHPYVVENTLNNSAIRLSFTGNEVLEDLKISQYSYVVSIYFDDHFVFENEFIDNELPY